MTQASPTPPAAGGKKSLIEYALLVGIRGGISFSQLIIVIVAGKLLDAATFGRFAIIYAGARLLASVVGLGAPSFLLKDVPARQARGEPWHKVSAVLRQFFLLPALGCILAAFVLEALGYSGTGYYPLYFGEGAALALTAYLWSTALLFGVWVRATRSSMEAMFISDLAPPLALLAALLALWGLGDTSLVHIFVLCCALLFAGQLVMTGWHLLRRWIPVGGADAAPIALRQVTPYWSTVLLNTASSQIDIIIAGAVTTPVATGVYAVIKRITNIIAIPQSIIVWILAPRVSRASAVDDRPALAAAARYSSRFAFLPALVIGALIGVTAPWWFAWFDIAWNVSTTATLALLLAANLLSVGFGQSLLFATQTGNPGMASRALTVATVVAALWMAVAGHWLGVVAIAAGQIVMYLLINWPIGRGIKRLYGIEITALNLVTSRIRGQNR